MSWNDRGLLVAGRAKPARGAHPRMSSLVCVARETPAKQKKSSTIAFLYKILSLTPQSHSATANEVHCVPFSPHWCDRAFILCYVQVRLSAATPKINGTKGALRRSQNARELNEPDVLLLSVIQNHALQCCEPHKQNADTFRFWSHALYSFPHPEAPRKFKPSVLHCCFVSCLEVVHKLWGKKGQAVSECFGKSASLRRVGRALFMVGSICTPCEMPKESSSKTGQDEVGCPEYFSLSKNKQWKKQEIKVQAFLRQHWKPLSRVLPVISTAQLWALP